MAEVVAIVSVVSSAAVAISVPFLTERLVTKRLKWQASDARLDELREILDEAALALDESRKLTEPGAIARKALRGHEARIGVRLGPEHPVRTSFSVAVSVWFELLKLADSAPTDRADFEATFLERWNELEIASRRFLKHASALVGPERVFDEGGDQEPGLDRDVAPEEASAFLQAALRQRVDGGIFRDRGG